MKITQEKLPASQIGLEIEVPSEMSQQAYERVIQQFTRSLNIPGFRKGKVPRHVLLQRVGATSVKQAALEDLIQKGFQNALEEAKIQAIGTPELKTSFDELVQHYEPGKGFTFSATVDVNPDVTLKQYKGFSVQAEEVPYDSTKVDSTIEEYRARVATLVPVEDRPAQRGDVAIVDYHGRLSDADTTENPDAGEFPGNQADDFQVELEEGRFIEGFIDGIFGMTVGEHKNISVPFPADYPLAEVAGQNATFSITLKELKEKELPELDDEFAQEISEFETLADLRESLESRYQKEAEQKTRQNKETAIADALLEQIEVDLPETMIRQEVDYLITQTAMQLQQQGIDVKQIFTAEMVPRLREQSRGDAILSLKRTLGLAEVAKQESLAVEPEAVQNRVTEIAQNSQGQDIDMNRLREVVQEELLTEKVLGWLLDNSTVDLVPLGTLKPPAEIEPDSSASVEPASAAEITVEAVASTVEDTPEAPEDDVPAKKTPAKRKKKATSKEE
jgi:trigger factor